MTPIELYFWPTPNGWKIAIMLEECELPYKLIWVDLSKKAQFKSSFLALSPNGRIPAIVDPNEQRERSDVEQWLFWQMAGLGPMAGQAAHFRNYKADKIDYAVKCYTDENVRLYNALNIQLGDRDFLAGSYSIADMACWPWIRGYKAYGIDLRDFNHLRAWFKRVGARPAVERAANIGKDQFKASQARAQSSI